MYQRWPQKVCSMILKNKSEREPCRKQYPEEKTNLWSKQNSLTMAREKKDFVNEQSCIKEIPVSVFLL